uniref:Uncharacterized protein n=1 Tax=Rhizophora mucronata TaxID=61149 RepID=A0A2P2PHT2_RHIMU
MDSISHGFQVLALMQERLVAGSTKISENLQIVVSVTTCSGGIACRGILQSMGTFFTLAYWKLYIIDFDMS